VLSVSSIDIVAGKALLVKSLSLGLSPGTVTAVVGPNGAGKTSLLKALSGELKPTSGSVQLQGKDLSHWSVQERARMIAVLPQQSLLNFSFQVGEVVALGRHPHHSGARRDAQIVEQALAAVDAVTLKQRDYTTLSGGEKQRVHLARVLAQLWQEEHGRERYLLLDEPTAALDLAHQHMILRAARAMAEDGVGVMVILHDLNLAAHYADSVIILDNGTLVASGDAHSVLTKTNIEQVFSIAVTLIPHPQTQRPLIIYREEPSATTASESAGDNAAGSTTVDMTANTKANTKANTTASATDSTTMSTKQ
jgi:iron complex transport system ATP-binding protein